MVVWVVLFFYCVHHMGFCFQRKSSFQIARKIRKYKTVFIFFNWNKICSNCFTVGDDFRGVLVRFIFLTSISLSWTDDDDDDDQ